MPTYSENGKNSYTAAAAVAKGAILKFTAADAQGLPSVTPTTAATDFPVAIALTDANQGEKVAVKILGTGGTTLVKAGGAVSAGATLGATGATAAASNTAIGVALAGASSGDLVEVATVMPVYIPSGD
jgi:hypothetical protein